MKVGRNIVIGFLMLFVLVALANLVVPFFFGFNVYLVSALILMLVVLYALMYKAKDSGKVKMIKLILVVLPVLVLLGVVYFNLFPVSFSLEVNYFYDLGGVREFKSPVLFPADRVSASKENADHRNLTAPMVYFNVPAEYSTGNISVVINFKDNIPRNESLIVGAKISSYEEYVSQVVFVPSLNRTNMSTWQIVYAEFNASDLFVEDGEYTFYINAPHLGMSSKKGNLVSIDWINVTERR